MLPCSRLAARIEMFGAGGALELSRLRNGLMRPAAQSDLYRGGKEREYGPVLRASTTNAYQWLSVMALRSCGGFQNNYPCVQGSDSPGGRYVPAARRARKVIRHHDPEKVKRKDRPWAGAKWSGNGKF